MKRIYTILAICMLPVFFNTLNAQNCGFAQTGIKYNYSSTDPVTGNCLINVDLYFDMFSNSGSKFITAHIWPKSSYPVPALTYAHPPLAADLTGAITVVIDHFQDHSYAYIDDTYLPDITVHPQYIGMGLTIGPSTFGAAYDRFTITNLNLTVPGGCGIPQAFTMDVWATESASMNSIHCFDRGFDFYANNPRVVGLLNCNLPRTYNVQVFSIDPASMTIDYNVYIDNGDNIFNKVQDTLNIKTVSGIVINSSTSYNSGTLSYPPYSNLYPYANMNLWVEVKSASLPNSVIYLIENTCAALPVKLKSFEAIKMDGSVLLKWITVNESFNKGFYIEKRIGDGQWVSIGFVSSKADKGTSNSEILYSYTDNTYQKAIIQYRLKQEDINGNYEYSPVRVIKNSGLESITIFPNPSNGNVSIVFPAGDLKYTVRLFSADGKQVREWQNCNSLLSVSGLKPGFYLFKISDGKNTIPEKYKLIVQ